MQQAEMSGQPPRATDGHLVWDLKAIEARQRDPQVQLYRMRLWGAGKPERIDLGGAYALAVRNRGSEVFAVVHDEA